MAGDPDGRVCMCWACGMVVVVVVVVVVAEEGRMDVEVSLCTRGQQGWV